MGEQVMGIEERTCLGEHPAMYEVLASLNFSPETNAALYLNYTGILKNSINSQVNSILFFRFDETFTFLVKKNAFLFKWNILN